MSETYKHIPLESDRYTHPKIRAYDRWIQASGPHSRLGKFYRKQKSDLERQNALVHEILYNVERDIERTQVIYTHASRISELSMTLEAMRDLHRKLAPYVGQGKISLTFDQPVIVPVMQPESQKSNKTKMAFRDPRTLTAEEWINTRFVGAILQEHGFANDIFTQATFDPTGRTYGSAIVDNLAYIGSALFDNLSSYDEYATLIGRPIHSVRAISLQDIGIDIVLVTGGAFDPQAEFAAQLSDLDTFRRGRFGLIRQDIADDPNLRLGVQQLMEGVIQGPLITPKIHNIPRPR